MHVESAKKMNMFCLVLDNHKPQWNSITIVSLSFVCLFYGLILQPLLTQVLSYLY